SALSLLPQSVYTARIQDGGRRRGAPAVPNPVGDAAASDLVRSPQAGGGTWTVREDHNASVPTHEEPDRDRGPSLTLRGTIRRDLDTTAPKIEPDTPASPVGLEPVSPYGGRFAVLASGAKLTPHGRLVGDGRRARRNRI